MKQTLSKLRRAVNDYSMINNDDKICVGISGGKDSMLLLKALSLYSRFSPSPFDLTAVLIDMGFGGDFSPLIHYAESLEIPLHIIPTSIGKIVFDERDEKNPCSLCAKLKRGALHNAALQFGCNKVALGHHSDDLAETLLMSVLYEGRINTFKAVTYLDRKKLTVIRPLVYMREKETLYAVNKNKTPFMKSGCPADGATKRELMKQMMKKISEIIPESDERIICSALPLASNDSNAYQP